jgi:hypothetical protein
MYYLHPIRHPLDYRQLRCLIISAKYGAGERDTCSKIEKHIQGENVIHAIDASRVDKLVYVSNFRQDVRGEPISDPCKSTVLVKPRPRPPIRPIQVNEHFIPHHKACRRMNPERPVEFEHLSKSSAGIVPVVLPTLFDPRSAGKTSERGRPRPLILLRQSVFMNGVAGDRIVRDMSVPYPHRGVHGKRIADHGANQQLIHFLAGFSRPSLGFHPPAQSFEVRIDEPKMPSRRYVSPNPEIIRVIGPGRRRSERHQSGCDSRDDERQRQDELFSRFYDWTVKCRLHAHSRNSFGKAGSPTFHRVNIFPRPRALPKMTSGLYNTNAFRYARSLSGMVAIY